MISMGLFMQFVAEYLNEAESVQADPSIFKQTNIAVHENEPHVRRDHVAVGVGKHTRRV